MKNQSMMLHVRWLMVLVLSFIIYHLSFSSAAAQSRDQQLRTRVDSALTARYYKTPYDTNYVVRPEGSLTLKLRLNQSGDAFHVKDDNESVRAKADLSTRRKTTISIGGSYRGISAALAINPAKLSGA